MPKYINKCKKHFKNIKQKYYFKFLGITEGKRYKQRRTGSIKKIN